MIKAQNLSIEYKRPLFTDISFLLGNREKVGLVGLNGCGKSTLLKILTGEEIPDSGLVEMTPEERIGYLPQVFKNIFDEFEFVGEFLESLVEDHLLEMWKVDRVLAKIRFEDVDLFEKIENLSPGRKMKLYLVKLLMAESTILLLDEPTNHLDIDGIQWLEHFVQKFDGIVIVISHDRSFLNNCINKVFEIDEGTLRVWDGNYDDFLMHKENYKLEREVQFKNQERKRAQLELLLENVRKISDGKKRGKAVRAAKKRMEREVTRVEKDAYVETKLKNVGLKGSLQAKKYVLEIKNLSFIYHEDKNVTQGEAEGTHHLIRNLDLDVVGNQKIWLLGANGIGKSTLVKLIIGQLEAQEGEIKWGNNLKWEYFSQDQSHIPMDMRVDDFIMTYGNLSYNESFGILENYLFDKSYRAQKISSLSPGQRARLSLAAFAQHDYDCLILDEPTNHLDIQSKEVVEKALANYKGAMFLISHDRYFAENINPDRIITIENGKIRELL